MMEIHKNTDKLQLNIIQIYILIFCLCTALNDKINKENCRDENPICKHINTTQVAPCAVKFATDCPKKCGLEDDNENCLLISLACTAETEPLCPVKCELACKGKDITLCLISLEIN